MVEVALMGPHLYCRSPMTKTHFSIPRILAKWFALAFFCCASVGASSTEYIKGVTYFGSAWPINFWNSNLNRLEADFREIKDDGFNAVVLVIPWGEFQPGLDPVRYNEEAYRRLAKVCKAAKGQGHKVFLRVSYLWDMYPGRQLPNMERINALVASDALMPAWQQYLARIGNATKSCAAGSFISWEDFWSIIHLVEVSASEADSARVSRQVGFDAWARKHADKDFLAKYAAAEKRLGAYPVPGRKSPDFRQVYRWFDDQLMDRLLPVVAKNLPFASIEARVDDDPIYDGEKQVGWYSHKKTYKVASSPLLMTYWAPAMGADNRGEVESAKKVVERFAYMQKKISDETSNKIFIEQFLFKDNTPAMSHNAVISPNEVSDFLKSIPGPMLKQTSGYALWGARDYEASTVFNGSFSLGTMDWKFAKDAKVVKSKDGSLAHLPRGASIVQTISSDRDLYRGFAKSTTLRLRASGPGIMTASYAGLTSRVQLGAKETLVNFSFPVAFGKNLDLVIASEDGAIRVTDVQLFNFTQVGDVRDSLGRPGRHLADIQALNRALEGGGAAPSRFEVSDSSFSQIAGVYAPEQEGSRWFAWAGPEVTVSVAARAPTIKVLGHIQPSLFKQAAGCTLDGFVGGAKVVSRTFTVDGPIDFSIPVAKSQIGRSVELKVVSSCVLNPKKQKSGTDERDLSFVLTEISAEDVKPKVP